MSRGRTLAVVTADRLDDRAAEFLRIAVGLLAGGHDVALRDLGGSGQSLGERASASSRTWVNALVEARAKVTKPSSAQPAISRLRSCARARPASRSNPLRNAGITSIGAEGRATLRGARSDASVM